MRTIWGSSYKVIETVSVGPIHSIKSPFNRVYKTCIGIYVRCFVCSRSLFVAIPNIPHNATWVQSGIIKARGHGQGKASNQLSRPYGLALNEDDGTVFIADYEKSRIVSWTEGDKEGRVVIDEHGPGDGLHQLTFPTDVLIEKETQSLFICDHGNGRVMRWSLRSGTTHGVKIIDNIKCFGLTMDNEGNLYVTDTEKYEMGRYQRGETMTNGTVVAGGNRKGNGLHQLNTPSYVFVDSEGALYVSDFWNHRVMK